MTSDQAMRELADKATDGPWEAWTDQDGTPHMQGRLMVGNAAGVIPDGETFIDGVEINPIAECYTPEDRAFIAACREWVPDTLRRLDNARVIARKLLEASGAYSTLDATPEFPEAYQLAQDLYEALDKLEHLDAPNGDNR